MTHYRIERCQGAGCSIFSEIATTVRHELLEQRASTASTPYSYRVRAEDAALPCSGRTRTRLRRQPRPRPTPSPRARPAPSPQHRPAPARSTSPGGRRRTTSGVTLYRIERCQGAGCSVFTEIATTSATSYANSGPRLPPRPTPTGCAPRTRPPSSAPYSNEASATTPAPPDTEPPSAPGTLTATRGLSSSQIDLSWGPATDNVGRHPVPHRALPGRRLLDLHRDRDHVDHELLEQRARPPPRPTPTGCAPRTRLSTRPYSNEASATTQAPPDTEPPSAPGTLNASAVSASQIDLSWGPATDNVGVTQYRIERCQGTGCSIFSEVATTSRHELREQRPGRLDDLLLPGARRGRGSPPGAYSNAANATTFNLGPVEPLPTLDSFNRRNENPLSAGTLVEWRQRLGRDGPACRLEHARVHEDDDLYRLAQRHAVRSGHRGVGAGHDASRHEQPAPPLRPPATARNGDLRRAHAAHESAHGGPTRCGSTAWTTARS